VDTDAAHTPQRFYTASVRLSKNPILLNFIIMLKYKSCKFLSKFVDKNFEPSLKPLKVEQIFTKKLGF